MSESRKPQTLAEASKEFHDACVALFWGVVKVLRVQEMVDRVTQMLVALNRWWDER